MALLIIGLFIAGYGAALVVISLVVSAKRRANPIAAHLTDRTVPGDQAPDGPVALRGVVAADGALRDPLEGEPVVWWRLEVGSRSSADRMGMSRTLVHEESHRVDFVVDDGSRQSVSVDAARISGYVAKPRGYGKGAARTEAVALSDDQRAMLADRSGRSSGDGLTALLYTVAVGDAVTVTGWLERSASGPVVVSRPGHDLIVTAVAHDEIVADREQRARNRVGTLLVGTAMIAAGLFLLTLRG